jgi:glycosyltransferase involved in cell wall biosynthesis
MTDQKMADSSMQLLSREAETRTGRVDANKTQKISVVIPLYNGAAYIKEAVLSVLSQTLSCHELIVVDDGSTDNGAEIVRALSETHAVKLLSKANGGQSSARNFGVAHAEGDLIALLDQDDVWYANHLQELVRPFLLPRSAELGWVYSNLDEIDANGQVVTRSFLSTLKTEHPKRDILTCLKEDMFVLPSASLISRKAFEAVNGFDESLSGYEDDDLFLRLFRAGFDNEYLDRPLSQWRIYSASSSYSPRMGKSRSAYARKLLATYPDDTDRGRYYTRDYLVPRFFRQIAAECRTALIAGNADAFRVAKADLNFICQFQSQHDPSRIEVEDLLITAVIPLYNGAPYIEEALRSVLRQSLAPAEIIVVDDGSTDDGAAIVERLAAQHPIRLLRKENGGQSSARNYGVAHAGGDFIALLDQDDAWYPNHLEELAKPFVERRARELGWVYSDLDEIDEQGRLIVNSLLSRFATEHPKRDLFSCLREDMYVLPSASLISRKAFEAVGGFDEQLSGYEDDDLFLRMFRLGFDNVFIGEPLSKWRIYPTSSSYSFRMGRSRVNYARKLWQMFPDDLERFRYYRRGLILPRFFRVMVSEYIKYMYLKKLEFARIAMDQLRALAPIWLFRQRLALFLLDSSLTRLLLRSRIFFRLVFFIRERVGRSSRYSARHDTSSKTGRAT